VTKYFPYSERKNFYSDNFLDINGTEYELFPSDEDLENYLKILFSKKPASDIRLYFFHIQQLKNFIRKR